MPTILNGAQKGGDFILAHAIVPVQQFPLSNSILGVNSYASGVVYNQIHAPQTKACVLMSATACVFGSVPTAGNTSITFTGPSGPSTWTITGANLTMAGNNTGAIFSFTSGNILPASTDFTLVGLSSGWAQSTGGLIVTVWAQGLP